MKKILRILLASVAAFTLFAIGVAIWQLVYVADGFAAAKADWLPKTASDIYYHIDSANRRYDFSISEADFRSYLSSLGYTPAEIKNTDSVYYHPMPKSPKDIQKISDPVFVTNGLHFEDAWSNGRYHRFIFNRESQRAYYAYMHH
jgi:hypothetical protein